MPSERFLRLNKDKKKKILDASREEFSAYPMEDISINRIIKNAGISRGSFYTYFKDKQDVLRFLLHEERVDAMNYARNQLEKNNYDYEEVIFSMIDYYVKLFEERRVFDRSANSAIKSGLTFMTSEDPKQTGCEDSGIAEFEYWLYEHLDKSKFRVESFELFKAISIHCQLIIFAAAARISLCKEKKDEIMKIYKDMLELMRKGILVS